MSAAKVKEIQAPTDEIESKIVWQRDEDEDADEEGDAELLGRTVRADNEKEGQIELDKVFFLAKTEALLASLCPNEPWTVDRQDSCASLTCYQEPSSTREVTTSQQRTTATEALGSTKFSTTDFTPEEAFPPKNPLDIVFGKRFEEGG